MNERQIHSIECQLPKKGLAVMTFTLLVLSVFGCGDGSSRNQGKSNPDTFKKVVDSTKLASLFKKKSSIPEAECENAIRDILCFSKLDREDIDPDCDKEAVTAEQKESVLIAYRELPKIYQHKLCNLPRIQIQDAMANLAFAAQVSQSTTQATIEILGLQSQLLVRGASQKDLISKKEQNNFSDESAEKIRSRQGLRIELNPHSENSQLVIVLAHELSHVIDYQNEITSLKSEDCASAVNQDGLKSCTYKKNKFLSVSWGNENIVAQIDVNGQPRELAPQQDRKKYEWHKKFPELGSLCFYNCTQKVSLSNVKTLYEELSSSSFLTTYASTSPPEDFAESLSLWILYRQKKLEKFEYILPTVNGDPIVLSNVIEHLQSPTFRPKAEQLENWIK